MTRAPRVRLGASSDEKIRTVANFAPIPTYGLGVPRVDRSELVLSVKHTNVGSRRPWQQSNSSVELPSAGSIPPFIEDQALIAGYFLPKPTISSGSTHNSRTHSLPNLTSTKSLSPVNSRFKPAKAMYTSRHQSCSVPVPGWLRHH